MEALAQGAEEPKLKWEHITTLVSSLPESMSAEAKSFILRCFEPDPDKRAFAHELLVDEFLKVSSKKRKSPSKLSVLSANTNEYLRSISLPVPVLVERYK